jgi:Tc toxin complex TcA C-terminal TcB-binding domain
MEALHARGFTTTAKILEIPKNSFPNALVGTVAFQSAADIYVLAQKLPWDGGDGPMPGASFRPVNAGDLIDCDPPCHLSPFGPVQYLYDMLALSDDNETLLDVLTSRRGDFGSLLATSANLDLPLPIIDIVNENLEAFGMGLSQEAYEGPMFNTLDQGLLDLGIDGAEKLQTAKLLTEVDLLRALPQHSTPHPLSSPNIYDTLKAQTGRPNLPYSQGLDVNRTYLNALGTSRFATMSTFQKDITELPQDASKEPEAFDKSIWRLPMRHDIAIEHLCISPEEAATIFGGEMSSSTALQLLGIQNRELLQASRSIVVQVSYFLEATGISYCEFLDLHASRIVKFKPDTHPPMDEFPACLPCCAETLRIKFDSEAYLGEVIKLAIFVRLWRRLRGRCDQGISMKILADICTVLQLFTASNVNKEFLTQLASLLMLKETWDLPWTVPQSMRLPFSPGDRRTELLALWSGAGKATRRYKWAIEALLDGVERYGVTKLHCPKRSASWRKIIAANLDDLASLSGFNDTTPWNSKPTCTIRFVEILSKLYASKFTTGEILFLFTTRDHLQGDDPYPITEEDESVDDPLNVPEDDETFGLWSLRRKLLEVEVCEAEACKWTWARIEATIHEMGSTDQSNSYGEILRYFAVRFFPEILEQQGYGISPQDRRFETQITTDPTFSYMSRQMWQQAGECLPFHFEARDGSPGILWVKLPLRNDDVLRALQDLRQLNPAEADAVQNLYLKPRAALTPLALVFTNFDRAADYMIQESCVYKRFQFFQKEFALFVKRCRVIAHHLHDAVSAAANIDNAECRCTMSEGCECAGMKVAWKILLRLIADENRPSEPWEDSDDSGARPQAFDFDPGLTGGAFAALLGLTGTGLLGRYRGNADGNAWVEMRAGMSGWGSANNYWNSPLITLIPGLSISADETQSLIASFKNGFALNQATGEVLSGAEPFTATWTGILLIECDGCYHFAMRCPMHKDDGACHCEKLKKWSVTIQRGQKTWTLIDQGMDDDGVVPNSYSKSVPLRRGAYDITIIFHQPEPDFDDTDDLRRFHTGFVLKYTGADTEGCLVEVPMKSLYIKEKDGPFSCGGEEQLRAQLQGGIHGRYISTLRDIRRTYQRAFKAILFAHRFCLSACKSSCKWESELGYLLGHPNRFQGISYYFENNVYKAHKVDFDFNFLPVSDTYSPPDGGTDQRVSPSWKRKAAMFGWFERIFDYVRLRKWVSEVCEPPVWLLFYHADSDSPQPVSQLVRFLGIEIALSKQVLEYFRTGSVWEISDTENISVLTDERWTTRVWMAGQYLHSLRKHFYATTAELTHTRPALWASSPDGNVEIDGTTGNANLTRFVQRCCLSKSDAAPRLNLIVELNNGLRLRARNALLAYLDFQGLSRIDLADRLLLDVEAEVGETTTRIDDAIAAVQRFMQRLVLGLEGASFEPSEEVLKRWECKFSSFDKWQAAQRRRYYFENWVHWEEANKLSRCEGFQSLKKSLKADVSTVSVPVRSQFWQQPPLPPTQEKLGISSDQSFTLTSSNSLHSRDEGLRILGTPDHSARPTWLTTASELAVTIPDDGWERDSHNRLASNGLHKSKEKQLDSIILPGSESLATIPLWIQSAVRLGTRFLRVAASSLPIGVLYESAGKTHSCCECKRDHPPVVDEYYFWLEDAHRFDPTDAPAPQNADLHINTSGTNPPTDNLGPQIDPRTREADPTSDWDAPTPQMLSWKAQPIIYLRWMRVHMGQLQDPRRSTEGIPLVERDLGTINFDIAGRYFDSLFFNVLGSTPGGKDFRYDIATDAAVVLPEAVKSSDPPPLQLPESLTSSLTAFPYFLYFEPGAPLVPVGTFSTSLVVATSLRADCRYEEASDWLRLAYDPLGRNNTWMQCQARDRQVESDTEKEDTTFTDGSRNLFALSLGLVTHVPDGPVGETEGRDSPVADLPCCPTSPMTGAKALGRAAVLEYLETLFGWANALRCRNSLETSQQALTLLSVIGRVLGAMPGRVNATDRTDGKMTLASFQPYAAPLNPRLMELYVCVEDSMSALRTTLNKRRLRNGALGLDMAHFGAHERFDGIPMHKAAGPMGCDSLCCFSCCRPYRFSFVLPKAMSWASLAKSTAASMLSAIEKSDTEALSSLRLAQERQMTELGLDMSKNNYRAADWDVQALDKQMANAITRLQYYQKLIQDGLNTGENAHVFSMGASMASRTSATVVDGVGQGMAAVPDMWIGIAGIAGSPLQFQQMPMGVKLGTGFAAAARILNTVADISSTTAGLSLTQSGWDRREDEWQHTADTTTIEIQQIKRQRLSARRRLENALRELNNTQRRIEHSAEVQDFARDKTSRYELYLYLQQENAALYRQCYEAALRTTREAEQALRFELGDANLSYITSEVESWDSLHSGLLAGEKLELALYSMERAHMNKNCREYELQKHVSLRLHFPAAFVMLKATGYCELDLPEWLFDLDYPGHYMRRIRSVSLTVPCVAGPYTGVHCKLQQLSSTIRFRPLRSTKDACKCCPKKAGKNPERLLSPCPNDANVWRQYVGTEAIATSMGQNDSGLFELSFNDPRYLPFEYTGAVSRWRIELPPENNQFDFDSLSDLIMHLNFTAREGGPEFARESNALAQAHVPGDGWRFFDVRHEMPEVWNVLRKEVACEVCKAKKDECDCCHAEHGKCQCSKEKHHGACDEARPKHGGKDEDEKGWCDKCTRNHHKEERKCRSWHKEEDEDSRAHDKDRHDQYKPLHKRGKTPAHAKRQFSLALTRHKFPFLTGRRGIVVTSLHLLLDTKGCDPSTAKMHFTPPHRAEEAACVDTDDMPLVRAEGGMLKGTLVLKQPLELEDGKCDPRGRGGGVVGTFTLPCELTEICGAWLLCGYHSRDRECCTKATLGCCEEVVMTCRP